MEYLGPDRESIGLEKAQIMRPGRPAIVSDPLPPASVVNHGEPSAPTCGWSAATSTTAGDRQQWSWAGRGRRYAGMAYPALRGANQLLNAAGRHRGAEALRDRLPITRRRCAPGWRWSSCRGASRSCRASRRWCWTWRTTRSRWPRWRSTSTPMGFYPRTHAVFGAMADKDVPALLARMRRWSTLAPLRPAHPRAPRRRRWRRWSWPRVPAAGAAAPEIHARGPAAGAGGGGGRGRPGR
jgi:dihydrofolate synthase / folylpolyglutamate synthase